MMTSHGVFTELSDLEGMCINIIKKLFNEPPFIQSAKTKILELMT